MTKGYIAELSASRNNIPGFGWMVLIGLIGFVYYKWVHKPKEGKDENKFHTITKGYVVPITILVVLTTLMISSFQLKSAKSAPQTSPNSSYVNDSGLDSNQAGLL